MTRLPLSCCRLLLQVTCIELPPSAPESPVKSLPVHCVQEAEVILIHQSFVLCCQLWSLIWQVVGQLNMLVLALELARSRTLPLLALH